MMPSSQEQHRFVPEAPHYGELFDDLVETFRHTQPELADKWEERLLQQVDNEEITIQQAYERLREIIQMRHDAETLRSSEAEHFEVLLEGEKVTFDLIRQALLNPEAHLGSGAVANVVRIKQRLCAKVVRNFENYAAGNNVLIEAGFLEKLKGFEVDGVRVPLLYVAFKRPQMLLIIMEELNAISFDDVIYGKEPLPDTFDTERYFTKMKNFLDALHSRGIYHLDIAERNLMVDRVSGDPFLIDFGKSKLKDEILGEDASDDIADWEKKDVTALHQVQANVRKHLLDGAVARSAT